MDDKRIRNHFRAQYTDPLSSRFEENRDADVMKLGHFLLFSYAERLNGEFDFPNDSQLDRLSWEELLNTLSRLSHNQEFRHSKLPSISEELSFFINGTSFSENPCSRIFDFIRPSGFGHTIMINEFDGDFEAFWASEIFRGIRSARVLDGIAECLGELDGPVGFILAANPYSSKELIEDLVHAKYFSSDTSTSDRAALNLKIKSAGYF